MSLLTKRATPYFYIADAISLQIGNNVYSMLVVGINIKLSTRNVDTVNILALRNLAPDRIPNVQGGARTVLEC